MAISEQLLKEVSLNLLKLASMYLPDEVVEALKKARDNETEPIAIKQLDAILINIGLSKDKKVAICQDTGLPLFFINLGTGVRLDGDPIRAFWDAAKIATKEVPLRQNCIHPITFKNLGTNTGWGIPAVHWEIVPESDYMDITAATKGFGSEIHTATAWVLTSEDIRKAAMRAVLDVVEDTMGEACPPVIVSLGIGGTSDVSTYNAKKGLFRVPFGADHPDPMIAEMEREMLQAVNKTSLGPMGFGGNNYALALNIEIAGTHTSIVPITVTFQCWADRYASARIYNDGRVEYISHPDALAYFK
ncbi:MAG: fumarate hydratase [Eubacteriales bacterium]|nr:fumarate hydratase [Eubacteriales bacterium]